MSEHATNSESPIAKNGTGTLWQAVQIVVPSVFGLLTLVFGFYINQAQGQIQSKVDDNKRILENQLAFQSALSQEFYKRRLTVYENACMELAIAELALNEAGTTTQKEKQAFDVISKFDQIKKGNSLYWSSDLQDGLDDFWSLGIKKLRHQEDPDLNRKISEKISALHEQMKDDLNVAKVSMIAQRNK